MQFGYINNLKLKMNGETSGIFEARDAKLF